MRVRSNQYSFFGKNMKNKNEAKSPPVSDFKNREVFESPHQQAIAKSPSEVVSFNNSPTTDGSDDNIPF